MSKFVVLLFCAVVAFLAGCATPSDQNPPSSWSDTNQPPVVVTEPTPPPPAVSHSNPPPVVHPAPPPSVVHTSPPAMTPPPVAPKPIPVYTWTSLERWTAANHLSPPRLLSKSPVVTYSLSSPRGVMVLTIGSREATWNGIALALGFAPEMIDGEVYLHALDLQKSLAPFLLDSPALFSAKRIIVIDPGHGGMNAGTLSVLDRRPEKEFTLDWARRLQPLLEHQGWRVFLTRTNDLDIALSNRVAFAEAAHADLFISLHFNSLAPDEKPAGLATYCLTPMGMPSNLTRGYPDILYQDFPNNGYDEQNVQLAERLQRSILRATNLDDRGINRARFIGVLRGQHRPSVLIEGGFLSNPREAKRIATPEFRQKLAEAVAAALN